MSAIGLTLFPALSDDVEDAIQTTTPIPANVPTAAPIIVLASSTCCCEYPILVTLLETVAADDRVVFACLGQMLLVGALARF